MIQYMYNFSIYSNGRYGTRLTFVANKVHVFVQTGTHALAGDSGRWFIERFDVICYSCRVI